MYGFFESIKSCQKNIQTNQSRIVLSGFISTLFGLSIYLFIQNKTLANKIITLDNESLSLQQKLEIMETQLAKDDEFSKNSTQKFFYNPRFKCSDGLEVVKYQGLQFCIPSNLEKKEESDRISFIDQEYSDDYVFTIGRSRYGFFDNGAYCVAKPEIYTADKDYLSLTVYRSIGNHFSQVCKGLASRIVLFENHLNKLFYFEFYNQNLPQAQAVLREKQFKDIIRSVE